METPVVEDLVAVDGSSGIYDKLLAANKALLVREFKEGRINKSDYATVLLGAVQSTMQMSMQFVLEKDKAELLEAQVALTEVQKDLAAAQTALTVKEGILADKKGELIDAQITEAETKEALTAAQVLQVTQETEKLSWESVAANAMVDSSVLGIESIIGYQTGEALAKKELAAAKVQTELAQTNQYNIDANSVIGRQLEIYKQQAASYVKDAKIKASDQLISAWKVAASIGEVPENSIVVSTNNSGKNHVLEALQEMTDAVND